MLVCLSWAMFCLNHAHAGERITIGVTLFLTMIFLNGYANTSLPKVSYVKSIDIFMVVSLSEILLIIFESIIVTKLFVTQECKRIRKDIRRRTMSKRKLSSVTNVSRLLSFFLLNSRIQSPSIKPAQKANSVCEILDLFVSQTVSPFVHIANYRLTNYFFSRQAEDRSKLFQRTREILLSVK